MLMMKGVEYIYIYIATTNDETPINVSHHIESAVRCGVSTAANFVSVNYLRAWNALYAILYVMVAFVGNQRGFGP
jgi:hypothetical protein